MTACEREALTSDPWLSTLLARPAYRLTDTVDEETTQLLRKDRLFVTAKIATSDVATGVALQNLGFRVVDTALTFDAARLDAPANDRRIRFAEPRDVDAVRDLAARAFRFSRFHLDPAIPDGLARRIKGAWSANYFRGERGDSMVVAEEDGQVVGALQLLWANTGKLVIDLIATAPEAARRGIARGLIGFAQQNGTHDGRRPTNGWLVGTQAANAPSCRLYESLGFRLSRTSFVLHHHGTSTDYREALGG